MKNLQQVLFGIDQVLHGPPRSCFMQTFRVSAARASMTSRSLTVPYRLSFGVAAARGSKRLREKQSI